MTDKTTAMTMFGGSGAVSIKNASAMAEALKGAAQEGARGQLPDGGVYISFSGKLDRYSIGVDKDPADPDEVWLVNIYDFQRGYICWKGGAPVARLMASIYGAPVAAPDFNQHGPFKSDNGEGWFPAKSITLRSIDRGIQGLFQTNTKSAVSEFAALEDKVADRLTEGLPAWPIIQLRSEKFKAQGQTNGKPVLAIYGWVGMKQVMAMSAMETVEDVSNALDELISQAESGDHEADANTTVEAEDDSGVEDFDDDVEDAEVAEKTEAAGSVPEVVAKVLEATEATPKRRVAGATTEKAAPPRRRAQV